MPKPKLSKHDKILQAALDLIAERGFHDAPISLIAKRAGVGAGTIYRYFKNKDELITAIFLDIVEKAYRVILAGYSAEKPIRERFMHLATAALRYNIEHPRIFSYMDQFLKSPYGTAIRTRMMSSRPDIDDVFITLITDGLAQRVLKDLPIATLDDLTFGPLISLSRTHIDGLCKLDERMQVTVVEACWDAIKR